MEERKWKQTIAQSCELSCQLSQALSFVDLGDRAGRVSECRLMQPNSPRISPSQTCCHLQFSVWLFATMWWTHSRLIISEEKNSQEVYLCRPLRFPAGWCFEDLTLATRMFKSALQVADSEHFPYGDSKRVGGFHLEVRIRGFSLFL